MSTTLKRPQPIIGMVPLHDVQGEDQIPTAQHQIQSTKPESVPELTPAKDLHGWALVVEDNDMVAAMVTEFINHMGYHVHHCIDGEAAIAWFSENHQKIELVLLDRHLPAVGGAGVFRAMRMITTRVPIVMCSGNISLSEEVELAREGVDGVVRKPFQAWNFIEILDQAITNRQDMLAKHQKYDDNYRW